MKVRLLGKLGYGASMSEAAAFDVAPLNRVQTLALIHVILFLTIKNQMTNENAGHYLNIRDGGQNPVQYNTKRDTCSPYIRFSWPLV